MEAKREAMLMEASDADATDIEALKEKLSELDSIKPYPYGTFHAVGISYI